MGFTNVTVEGQLTASNGVPVAGVEVTATLSEAVHNGGTSFVGIARTAVTSATGQFSLTVPANTDPGTYPSGSYYTFTSSDGTLESEVVVGPSDGPVQLAQLQPAPSATGEVLSVFGRTGAVVAKTGDYAVGNVTGAAPLAAPALTGKPTTPTATPGTNNTQIASTAYSDASSAAAAVGKVAPSVFVIPTAAAAPAEPVADQAYFDSVKGEIGVFSGGKWVYTGELV